MFGMFKGKSLEQKIAEVKANPEKYANPPGFTPPAVRAQSQRSQGYGKQSSAGDNSDYDSDYFQD